MEEKELRDEIHHLQNEVTKLAYLMQAGFRNLENNIQESVRSKDWGSYIQKQREKCRCDVTTIDYVHDQVDALLKTSSDRQLSKLVKH